MQHSPYVLALVGGVGGAKLALGLSRILSPLELTVVVNTGDDEEFYGLHVSPDLDTVMYTLAGLANPKTGWGVVGDTFYTLAGIRRYGAETWFGLGDIDLATHLRRTEMLRNGDSLTTVTQALCRSLGVMHSVVPMTDNKFRTIVATEIGDLPFQEYFVKYRCEPRVSGLPREEQSPPNKRSQSSQRPPPAFLPPPQEGDYPDAHQEKETACKHA